MKCHKCGGYGDLRGFGDLSVRCEHCDGTGLERWRYLVEADERQQQPPDEPPHPAEG